MKKVATDQFLAPVIPQLVQRKETKLPALLPPRSGTQRRGNERPHQNLRKTMQAIARPVAMKTVDLVTDKTKQGDLLVGTTALCALVALLGVGLSAAGIPYLHLGSITIPVDVSKLAGIAFYSGAGAMLGFQLRKQGKLKAEEDQIQHRLEQIQKVLEAAEVRYTDTSDAVRLIEGQIQQMARASRSSLSKSPSIEEIKAAVSLITSAADAQPQAQQPPIERSLSEYKALQARLAQIYERTGENSKGEKLLKKIAILAAIGFITIFGLQLYIHFGGHLPFQGLGLEYTPSLLAASTVLMYGLSLLDLGLSKADSVPVQVKKAQLEHEQQRYRRKLMDVELEENHLATLKQQAAQLHLKLEEARIEIGISEFTVGQGRDKMRSIRDLHLKRDKTEKVGFIARELEKPGLGANLTKGVLIGATVVALAALAGLIYSMTGNHVIDILGNVTALTPQAMGMVAFYGVAIAIVAQQVLARMKTQEQIATQKRDFEELEQLAQQEAGAEQEGREFEIREVTAKWDTAHGLINELGVAGNDALPDREQLAQREALIGQYKNAIGDLKRLRSDVAVRAKQREFAAPAGRLFQQGLGVATALAGLAVLAYLAYSLIDHNGAATLFKQAHSTNLVQAAILASNGFAILYAGASLWQNARIREDEAKRRLKEQDLEAGLLGRQITEHQNALLLEQAIYAAQSQIDEKAIDRAIEEALTSGYGLGSEDLVHQLEPLRQLYE